MNRSNGIAPFLQCLSTSGRWSPAWHTLGPVPHKRALPKQAASFIDTTDCLPVAKLPDGTEWTYEIKLDGYRLEAVRTSLATTLYCRQENVLNQWFPYIATALKDLPNDTVIDGELGRRTWPA
jgi:ATP-dependent DNA ligase